MHLGLGTAQFGLPYGATNSTGVPSLTATSEILEAARQGRIDLIDTAADYGGSEDVLGKLLPKSWSVRLVTKTQSTGNEPITDAVAARVRETALRSLERLGQRPLHGLLVHRGEEILKPGGERLIRVLRTLKDEGNVEKIGVSIYGGQEIDAILERTSLDMVQLPYNLCDRRLDEGGQITRLKNANVEIHVRSIFLQGLLLESENRVPPYFADLRPVLRKLGEAFGCGTIDRVAACLSAAARHPAFDALIVGVTTPKEISVLLQALDRAMDIAVENDRFRMDDPNILDPRTWPPRDQLLANPRCDP